VSGVRDAALFRRLVRRLFALTSVRVLVRERSPGVSIYQRRSAVNGVFADEHG
jgi:hypothetical protein